MSSSWETPAEFLERCSAEVSGWLAWLSTDLLRKGAADHAERVNQLSERFDAICTRLDALGRAMEGTPPRGSASGPREERDRVTPALMSTLESTERLTAALVEGREPFTEEQDRQLTERLEAMETALEEGERAEPVPGGRP